jgi:hypothetical protein
MWAALLLATSKKSLSFSLNSKEPDLHGGGPAFFFAPRNCKDECFRS